MNDADILVVLGRCEPDRYSVLTVKQLNSESDNDVWSGKVGQNGVYFASGVGADRSAF